MSRPWFWRETVIEHCAHAIWILGAKDDSADRRLARALLDYENGLLQAEKYAREFIGEASPGHVAKKKLTAAFREEARAIFSPPYGCERSRSQTAGPRWRALSLTHRTRRQRGQPHEVLARRTGGTRHIRTPLNTSARYPNEITGLTYLRDPSDPASIALREDRRTHEPLVRTVVSFFYSAISHALDYSGIAIAEHTKLGDEIEKFLPGHFNPNSESGPFQA